MGIFRSRRQRPRRFGERGSVIVESAIVLPVVFLCIFGTLEFGLAFRSYLTLTNSTRDAARFASSLGKDPDADFQVVNEIRTSLSALKGGTLSKVIIFKGSGSQSTTSSGALAACRAGSVPDLCNTYTGSSLTSTASAFGCGYSSPDRYWCPAVRKENVSDPPDYIGVYIESIHHGVTGAFGSTRTFHDEIVMRIEPVRI